ncbi:MAG: DUF4329 domain-containing protein [Candidatus Kapabacteria bacterium]|nr:DUF4329 domain-containing protein [Candidatus Kapabacteria bacterium]
MKTIKFYLISAIIALVAVFVNNYALCQEDDAPTPLQESDKLFLYNSSIGSIIKNTSPSHSQEPSFEISPFNGNLTYKIPISSHTIDGATINFSLYYNSNVTLTSFIEVNNYEQFDAVQSPNLFEYKAVRHIEAHKQSVPIWLFGVNGIAIQALFTHDGGSYSGVNNKFPPRDAHDNNPTNYYSLPARAFTWLIDGYDFDKRINIIHVPDRSKDTKDYKWGYQQDAIKILRVDGSIIELRNGVYAYASKTSPEPSNNSWAVGYYYEEGINKNGYAYVEYDDTYWSSNYQGLDYYPFGIPVGKVGNFPQLFKPRIVHYFPGDGLEYMFREVPLLYDIYCSTLYLEEIRNCHGTLTKLTRTANQSSGRGFITEFSGHKLTYSNDYVIVEALGKTYKYLLDRYKISSYCPDELPYNSKSLLSDLSNIKYTTLNYWKDSPISGLGSHGYGCGTSNRHNNINNSMVYLIKEIIGPDKKKEMEFDYTRCFWLIINSDANMLLPDQFCDNYKSVQYRMNSIKDYNRNINHVFAYNNGVDNTGSYIGGIDLAEWYQPWREIDAGQTNMVNKYFKLDLSGNTLLSKEYSFIHNDVQFDNSLGYYPNTHHTICTTKVFSNNVNISKKIETFGFGYTPIQRVKPNADERRDNFDIPTTPYWDDQDDRIGKKILELRNDSYIDEEYNMINNGIRELYTETHTYYPPTQYADYHYLPTSTKEKSIIGIGGSGIETIKEFAYEYGQVYSGGLNLSLITKKTTTLKDNLGNCILKTVDEFDHIPLSQVTSSGQITKNNYFWDREKSQEETWTARLTGLELTNNSYNNMTLASDHTVYSPPIYYLKTKSTITDSYGNILKGERNVFDESTNISPNQTYSFNPGQLKAKYFIGANGIQNLIATLNYNGSAGTNQSTHLLSEIDNKIGSSKLFYYNYQIPALQAGTSSFYNSPYGIMTFADGSHPFGKQKKLFDEFPIFEQALAAEKTVRKYKGLGSSLSLKTDRITTLLERNYWGTLFGTVKGIVDPNGYYYHSDYDFTGRLVKAWLPLDFSDDGGSIYYGNKSIKLYGYSEKWSETITKFCPPGQPDNVVLNPKQNVPHEMIINKMRNYFDDPQCDPQNPNNITFNRDNSAAVLIYNPQNNDAFHTCGNIDEAWLNFVVSSNLSECIMVKITFEQLNTSNVQGPFYYVFNCPTMKNIPTPWQGIDINAIPCQVDLLNSNVNVMNMFKGNQPVKISFKTEFVENGANTYVFGMLKFCNDADGTRPELVVKSVFPNAPEFDPSYPTNDNNGYSIAYKYDQNNNTEFDYKAKLDDPLHSFDDLSGSALRSIEYNNIYSNDYLITKSFRNNDNSIYKQIDYDGRGNVIDSYDEAGARTAYNIYNGYGQIAQTYLADLTFISNVSKSTVIPSNNLIDFNSLFSTEGFQFTNSLQIYQTFFNNICNIELTSVGNIMTSAGNDIKTMKISDYFGRLRIEGKLSHNNSGIWSFTTQTKYDYDLIGNITSVTNPNGQVIQYFYDDFQRKVAVDHPDFGAVQYQYDDLGNVRFIQNSQQNNEDNVKFIEYDDLNRIVSVGEANFQTSNNPNAPSTNGLTFFGNISTSHAYANKLNNGFYDPLSANSTLWLTPISAVPNCWSQLYGVSLSAYCNNDYSDFFDECLPSELWRHDAQEYNKSSQGVSQIDDFENFQLHPDNLLMTNSYDELPQRTGTAWANFPVTFLFDRLTPTGRVRNLKGNVAAVANREHGNQPFNYTIFSYDERGRVETIIHYTDNLGFDAVYYSYNSMDKLTSVRTADPKRQHSTWYGYDDLGRLNKVWTKLSDEGFGLYGTNTFYHSYLQYPPPQEKPSLPDITYTYTKRDQIETCKYPNLDDLETNYSYNSRQFLTSIESYRFGKSLFNQVNHYASDNPFGMITSYDISRNGQPDIIHQAFQYSFDNMLMDWTHTVGNNQTRHDSYSFDKVGNRNSVSGDKDFNYHYENYDQTTNIASNQLTSVTQNNSNYLSSFDYDLNGALKIRFIRAKSGDLWNMRLEEFEYNVNGQLETYKLKNAFSDASSDEPCLDETAQTTWKYRYSAAGEREQKRQYSNSSSPQNAYPWEYYLLGAENKQLAVYHGISSYCSGPGSDVFMYPSEYLSYGAQGFSDIISRPDGTKEYSIFDHLGSVRERFSQSGELIASYDYEPYGEVIGKVEKPRLTYIDKEKDKESKLHDFGARKYENSLGRFFCPDKMWEKMYSVSPYVYSLNNPIRLFDKNGYLPGDAFSSPEQAAHDFGKNYSPLSMYYGGEFYTLIYLLTDGNYSYTIPEFGCADGGGSKNYIDKNKTNNTETDAHTHERSSSTSAYPSSKDIYTSKEYGYGFVITPEGNLLLFDEKGKVDKITSDMPKDPKTGIDKDYEKNVKNIKETRPIPLIPSPCVDGLEPGQIYNFDKNTLNLQKKQD